MMNAWETLKPELDSDLMKSLEKDQLEFTDKDGKEHYLKAHQFLYTTDIVMLQLIRELRRTYEERTKN